MQGGLLYKTLKNTLYYTSLMHKSSHEVVAIYRTSHLPAVSTLEIWLRNSRRAASAHLYRADFKILGRAGRTKGFVSGEGRGD